MDLLGTMYLPGTLLLWLATLLGAYSTVSFALAVPEERPAWLTRGRQAFVLMTVAVVLASILLLYLLLVHDYRLAYVWSYSDNSLPLSYLVSSFWAGQEGSFLLWVLCGCLMGLPLLTYARKYESRVMLIYNLTLLSLLLLLLRQSPFRFHEGMVAGQVPVDGNGLNPLLQNPWMVLHPPVMFVGYASLAIPFAFALAALWMRRYEEWLKVSLPWVLVSLLTLGAAIMTGGYWAYETLGWGGYWGWDPVENASLVPWLLTAALTHGLLLQRGSNRFRRLNLVLAVLAYLTVVYATFLTRSGVLADFSVHSFVDLGITGWLVLNISFFLVLSVIMLVWRWREIPVEVGTEPFLSRTIFLVLGIIVLVFISLVVGLGTSSPLITRLVGEPSQVGPDFYNRTGFWQAVVLAVILGVAPLLTWRRAKEGAGRQAVVALVVILVVLAGAFAAGLRLPLGLLYLAASLLVVVNAIWALAGKVMAGAWRKTGAALAHLGIGLMLIAFMTTGWLDREAKVRLLENQPQEVHGYTLTFKGSETNEQNREEMLVEVVSPRGTSSLLKPLMWVNRKSNQLVANPAIRSYLLSDLYLAPAEYQPAEEAAPANGLVLDRSTPVTAGDWTISLLGFKTGMHGSAQGSIAVTVELQLQPAAGGETVAVEPLYVIQGGQVERTPVPVPGIDGATVQVQRIDADGGRVWLQVTGLGEEQVASQGKPAYLVVDVSTKPLILLVWLGTLLALAGNLIALYRRWREGSAAAAPSTGTAE